MATSLEIEFVQAVKSGDAHTVKRLARLDPGLVDQRDPTSFGAIPLRHAVERNDLSMVDTLLELGADINAKSDWWAGGFGVLPCPDPEMGELLLRRGARLDAYGAAGMGWTRRLRGILDRDPEQVHMKGGDGQRPLHVAKNVETVELLVERGAELEARDVDHGSTPVQYQIDSPENCRRLIELGAEPDIFTACKLGDRALAERVLARNPDALDGCVGEPPFVSAGSHGGHIYLYKLGPTVRPLALAAREGHRELVDYLLTRAEPRQKLLHYCWEAESEKVRALLRDNPGIVAGLPRRDTALIADAAWENRVESVRCMIEAGFDLEVHRVHRSTALDRAAFHGFAAVIQLLLAHGASIHAVNEFGATPLGCCVYGSVHSWRKDGDYPRSVSLLIGAGSRVDRRWIPCGNPEVDRILEERA